MTRPKTASLAILGTTAMIISVLASPAIAEGTKAKGTMAKSAKHTQAQIKGSQTVAKGQRHVQHHATRSQRISSANAALPSGRPAAGPGQVAGNVVGGAVATAGAIATAPFRAFDNSYNYYGYGYGGRDWKTYAAHNKLACTPGTTFKGPDGKQHPCQ
jgi:hypothetical protein